MPTRTFSISSDTSIRTDTDGSSGTGCGNSKHIYVGRYGTKQYKHFAKFTLDYSGMAKITAATLNVYTDEYDTFGVAGEPGIFAQPASADHPEFSVYRLGDAFSEGNNADGHYDSGDYTSATQTGTGVHKNVTKGANLLQQVNVLDIVKAWAPSSVAGGGRHTNYGIVIKGSTDPKEAWSGWADEHGNPSEEPSITVTYELGPTKPDAPSNMTPVGAVASVDTFEGNFTDQRATDTLATAYVQVYDGGVACTVATNNRVAKASHGLAVNDTIYFTSLTGGVGLSLFTAYRVRAVVDSSHFTLKTATGTTEVDVTNDYSAATYSKLLLNTSKVATNSERVAAHFIVERPPTLKFTVGVTYRWRAQVVDQEGQSSGFGALVSFSLTNTAPNPPVLSPIDGSSYATLNLVKFTGTYSDPDGDPLSAHQVQLALLPPGDSGWDEPDRLLWDTGYSYAALGDTDWTDYYGGRALVSGIYYWRARNIDARQGVSNWTYGSIVLTADFSPEPGSYDNVQINPNAPWRILIRDVYLADGVTKTAGRGPGTLVAVLEEAKNVGASIVYNSPGELHFTLLKDDEQIGVIEPRQVHYAVEFYSGDGWQEKFAGVIWDADATETDVVFKGIDYLALYDTVIDSRYDANKPDKSYKNNGSYYSQVTVRNIILDQLAYAKKQPDSWVGFIGLSGADIPAMGEKISIYSTFQPVLSFVSGLLDSHRQGQGIRTRIRVVKTTTGAYKVQIIDNPGATRVDLALYYGELVQGYRVILFGDQWANVMHVVGRNRDGVKVTYKTISGKSFQPSTSLFGRIATVAVMDGVQDAIDLNRRGLQAAMQAAKIGRNIAIGLRVQFLGVLQGYDLTDLFPVKIDDGAIDTDAFGSGYWAAMAVAWEATDIGEQSLIITLMPKEDSSAPDPSLIQSSPISPQPEWQLGWTPPDPLKATSKFWLDQSTGKVYVRDADTGTLVPVTGTP